jgi:hypothetical protein
MTTTTCWKTASLAFPAIIIAFLLVPKTRQGQGWQHWASGPARGWLDLLLLLGDWSGALLVGFFDGLTQQRARANGIASLLSRYRCSKQSCKFRAPNHHCLNTPFALHRRCVWIRQEKAPRSR